MCDKVEEDNSSGDGILAGGDSADGNGVEALDREALEAEIADLEVVRMEAPGEFERHLGRNKIIGENAVRRTREQRMREQYRNFRAEQDAPILEHFHGAWLSGGMEACVEEIVRHAIEFTQSIEDEYGLMVKFPTEYYALGQESDSRFSALSYFDGIRRSCGEFQIYAVSFVVNDMQLEFLFPHLERAQIAEAVFFASPLSGEDEFTFLGMLFRHQLTGAGRIYCDHLIRTHFKP